MSKTRSLKGPQALVSHTSEKTQQKDWIVKFQKTVAAGSPDGAPLLCLDPY